MKSLVKTGAYLPFVQNKVIPAQYFKDYLNMDKYLSSSIFLPDINNEIGRSVKYERNILSLNSMVLIEFEDDDVLDPKESAQFGFYNEQGIVVKLEDQEYYQRNSLGLKTLMQDGKLLFKSLPRQHMKFTLQEFKEIVEEYLVPKMMFLVQ